MKKLSLWVGFGAVAVAAVAWAQQTTNLYINGNLASTNVFMHNGLACVPIKDVASALKLSVVATGQRIDLSPAGGANQAGGLTGKVGDVLFNGFARFQVVKVIRGKQYTNQFSGDNQLVTADPGKDLVVVMVRIKNGINNSVTVMPGGGDNTGLADTDGHSYSCRTGMTIDWPSRGISALPGAAVDFALTFEVPEGAQLGDLVYQLSLAGSNTNGSEKKKFRVSL